MADINKTLQVVKDKNIYTLRNDSLVDNMIINNILPAADTRDGQEIILILNSNTNRLSLVDNSNIFLNEKINAVGGVSKDIHVKTIRDDSTAPTTPNLKIFSPWTGISSNGSESGFSGTLGITSSGIMTIAVSGYLSNSLNNTESVCAIIIKINGVEQIRQQATHRNNTTSAAMSVHYTYNHVAGNTIGIFFQKLTGTGFVDLLEGFYTITSNNMVSSTGITRDPHVYSKKMMVKLMYNASNSKWYETGRMNYDY
jgi:hypothetical protein